MKKETKKTVFVISYNPALASVIKILRKHWSVMTRDPYLKTVFPSPPIVAYRRAKNLKDKLIRAKIPPPPPKRNPRKILDMKRCNKFTCETCPFVKTGSKFTNPYNNKAVVIIFSLNCNSNKIRDLQLRPKSAI